MRVPGSDPERSERFERLLDAAAGFGVEVLTEIVAMTICSGSSASRSPSSAWIGVRAGMAVKVGIAFLMIGIFIGALVL